MTRRIIARLFAGACALGATTALPAFAGSRLPYGAPVIATASEHVLFLKPDGVVYGWGDNTHSQLGDGGTGTHTRPHGDTNQTIKAIQVAAGTSFSLALDQSENVYGWGLNASCQLGRAASADVKTATAVTFPGSFPTYVRTIAAGTSHALAIDTRGGLWVWGDNTSGKLGTGSAGGTVCTPRKLTATSWLNVVAGDQFSVGLKADGTLWAWGANESGQLGVGDTTSRNSPTLVKGSHIWVAVAAGKSHVVAIAADGTLWAWGLNDLGQLGLTSTSNKNQPTQVSTAQWRAVAAGDHHSLAVAGNGALWSFGSNTAGQLGRAATSQPLGQIGTAQTWQVLSAHGDFSTALGADGKFYTWGAGAGYVLGNGATDNVATPKTSIFSDAKPGLVDERAQVRSDGSVTTTDSWAPKTNITGPWIDVADGSFFTLAVKADGTLWGWGNDYEGQLGHTDVGTFGVVQIGTDTNWVHVYTGVSSAFGLKTDGSMYAWGENDGTDGRLGVGDTSPRYKPTLIGGATAGGPRFVTMGAANSNTYAVTADGQLWGWGANDAGNVGDGNSGDDATPVLSPEHVGTLVASSGYWVAVVGGAEALGVDSGHYYWGNGSGYIDEAFRYGVVMITGSSSQGSTDPAELDEGGAVLTGGGASYSGGRAVFRGAPSWQLTTNGNVQSLPDSGAQVLWNRIW